MLKNPLYRLKKRQWNFLNAVFAKYVQINIFYLEYPLLMLKKRPWSVLNSIFAKYANIKKFYFEKPSLQAYKGPWSVLNAMLEFVVPYRRPQYVRVRGATPTSPVCASKWHKPTVLKNLWKIVFFFNFSKNWKSLECMGWPLGDSTDPSLVNLLSQKILKSFCKPKLIRKFCEIKTVGRYFPRAVKHETEVP